MQVISRGVITVSVVVACTMVCRAAASQDVAGGGNSLPPGLESYLQARIFEANGEFREAMDAYADALQEGPDVAEIRLAYAGFLVDIGMAARALEIVPDADGLGPEGLRIRALALAQRASRDRSLVPESEAALRAAAEANENDLNVRFSLAQVLAQQQKLVEAEQMVADLREDLPSNSRLLVMHAELLRSLGRTQEATDLYARCVDGGPSASRCRDQLVEVLIELGRPGEAGQAMLGWLDDLDLDGLMRAATLLWEGRRFEQSLETVRRVLARAPDSPRARRLEAHLLSSTGRHEEATATLRKLLRKQPDDVELTLALAWSTSLSGDHDGARQLLDDLWSRSGIASGDDAVRIALTAARLELIAEHPIVAREWLDRIDDPTEVGSDFVRLLAETYRRQEQWRSGIGAMTRLQPRLPEPAQLEAEALEAEFLLRLDDARAWRRLRPLLDSDDAATVLLGLEVLQGLEHWSDVERESGHAIERFGGLRDLMFVRAAALERLGEFVASAELFRVLVSERPNDAAAANYLGYMLADRGVDLDEAYVLISRAVALDPENSAYLDSLGWVHFRRGDLDEAERWLRRAIDLDGNAGDGTLYCHLGEVLFAKGELEEGRRLMLLGLDRGCENSDYLRSLLDRVAENRP